MPAVDRMKIQAWPSVIFPPSAEARNIQPTVSALPSVAVWEIAPAETLLPSPEVFKAPPTVTNQPSVVAGQTMQIREEPITAQTAEQKQIIEEMK